MHAARMLGVAAVAAALFGTEALGQTGSRVRPPAPCVILGPEIMTDGHYSPTLWPGGVVPYRFDSTVTEVRKGQFRAAAAEIEAVSSVRFVEWSGEADHVLVRFANANASYVGRKGGAQDFYIYDWEYRHIIVHELMHALGFFHEHQRPDRDQHITVHPCNVYGVGCESGTLVTGGSLYENNFKIVNTGQLFGAYDYESLLHYGPCDFAAWCYPFGLCNCPPGTETITASRPFGGATQLSAGDIAGLNALYPGTPPPPPCYANCDGSSGAAGVLGMGDFACFLSRFSAGDPWANCDGSTAPPALNVADFQCFLQKFAAGCP